MAKLSSKSTSEKRPACCQHSIIILEVVYIINNCNLFVCQQGLETIKLEMEDVGEPLVDVNFGHGRYDTRHTNYS